MTANYHALTVDLPEEEAEILQALLPDWGAHALEVRDREAPPMPGVRGPRAGEAIVVATFDSADDARSAAEEITARFASAKIELEARANEDWSVTWRARIRAVEVGRLWVGPPWLVAGGPADKIRVTIEPKMAFGTGDHPTTRLCLAAIDAFLDAHANASVLDVGTGSGVLAIAAFKLGATRVVGVDVDAPSIELAQENARLNDVESLVLSTEPLEAVEGTFDLVLANILANTLVSLAPALAQRTKQRLVLAGVLRHQRDEVAAAFQTAGLDDVGGAEEGEWVRLDFERRS